MLELFMHCHYIVALSDSDLGSPEVNLPVVPGMEMCHIPFRRTSSNNQVKLFKLLLEGRNVKGKDSIGWLTDFSGNMNECIQRCWTLASEGESAQPKRIIEKNRVNVIFDDNLSITENKSILDARKAILDTIISSCSVGYSEAIDVQSRHSAEFMTTSHCKYGMVGSEYSKVSEV
jgi:enoyl-CoA hydratase/carnithine racemase